MTAFSDLGDIAPMQIWDGVVARVWQGEQAALTAIELAPSAHVPEHAHANEQTGVLIKGSMTFRIGDETKELQPGSTWVIPGNVPHSVDAGPDGAVLVELFAPPRGDWGSLERLDPGPLSFR
jgi:quercetin dioxygenase-like cupin family protein